MPIEAKYEEQFTAFVDFLGFSEASTRVNDVARLKVLELLRSLSARRGEFDLNSRNDGTARHININPAISTFSDHIVISYPLDPIAQEFGPNERITSHVVLDNFIWLLTNVAASALRIGFLVRGGATIGKLYHAGGVVFGEALIKAVEIESRIAIYPRVILSHEITDRPGWICNPSNIRKCADGLYQVDYFGSLPFSAVPPGDDLGPAVKERFNEMVTVIDGNIAEHRKNGRLRELAKWAWFAQEFRSGIERVNQTFLRHLGISPDSFRWPR